MHLAHGRVNDTINFSDGVQHFFPFFSGLKLAKNICKKSMEHRRRVIRQSLKCSDRRSLSSLNSVQNGSVSSQSSDDGLCFFAAPCSSAAGSTSLPCVREMRSKS